MSIGHLVVFSAESVQTGFAAQGTAADGGERQRNLTRRRLCGGGQEHLIFSPAQAAQPQPVELKDALHVRKPHLDLFCVRDVIVRKPRSWPVRGRHRERPHEDHGESAA